MPCPFPGMDPWLEQQEFWSNLHTSLMTALRDQLAQSLRPNYYVDIDKHTYITTPGSDQDLMIYPDVSVIKPSHLAPVGAISPSAVGTLPMTVADPLIVDLPYAQVVRRYLKIMLPKNSQVVTVIEILSPENKRAGKGRMQYEEKRLQIMESMTHLVEIDLLRGKKPMPFILRHNGHQKSDYRILVSRWQHRPQAQLYAFSLRQPIPRFKLPLLKGDEEPIIDLTSLLHNIYERAGYDLVIDYQTPPTPRLSNQDATWATEQLKAANVL